MALKLGKLFGGEKAKSGRRRPRHADDAGQDGAGAAAAYDPLASVSIMDQLRSATANMTMPRKLPRHRPPARGQAVPDARRPAGHVPRVRGADGVPRQPPVRARRGAAAATATEMQMLSQRLARGSALAAQGQAPAFAAVKDSRDRFKTDLDALLNGGTVRGVSVDVDAGRDHRQAPERRQGALGARRHGGGAAAGERDQPDVARQGPRGAQRRQQRAPRARADRRPRRSGRPAAACARSSTRTSSPCCRSGSRRTPTRWRRRTRSTRRSRSCSARTRARSATS